MTFLNASLTPYFAGSSRVVQPIHEPISAESRRLKGIRSRAHMCLPVPVHVCSFKFVSNKLNLHTIVSNGRLRLRTSFPATS